MPKKQLAYKVLRNEGGLRLVSAIRSTNPVVYKLDEWSKPDRQDNQFLFVFETLRQAQKFSQGYGVPRACIYRVEIMNPTHKRRLKKGEGKIRILDVLRHGFPKGTLLVDAVKLIKKIQ